MLTTNGSPTSSRKLGVFSTRYCCSRTEGRVLDSKRPAPLLAMCRLGAKSITTFVYDREVAWQILAPNTDKVNNLN